MPLDFGLLYVNEIFGVFKGWKIMLKKETGKQKGLGGWMRCGLMVRMVMALHGLAHYSLWLQVGLSEMLDAKVVKLALQKYSGVWFFGDMAYACMGNDFELRVKKGVFLGNSGRIKRYLWDPCTSTFIFLVTFVECANLRACGSFSAKKKVEVDSGVTLAKEDEVDDVCIPRLGGDIPLCTLKEWVSYSWSDMIVDDGMIMMGSNVIDRRCVNLVSKRALVECGLMCSHEMVYIDRRLWHFQDFVAWGSVILGRVLGPMVSMGL